MQPRPLWHLFVLSLFVIVLIFGGGFFFVWGYDTWEDRKAAQELFNDGFCNIAVIPIQGTILSYDGEYNTTDDNSARTSGDYVALSVRWVESDENIKGILARIDSYGGSGSGGEIMLSALRRSALPVAAVVRDSAVSAGYMAAVGADVIIASRQSTVGSIGFTSSYLQNVKQNEEEGLEFVGLASGKFKDAGNPNRPLTQEEREMFQRDLSLYHKAFVDLVAENRQLPVEVVEELADGWAWPGEVALEKGLVDILGDQETARDWFASVLGLAPEEIVFCE